MTKKKHCYTCGGHGFRDKECPECHRKPMNMNLDKEPEVAKQLVVTAKNALIPQQYVGVTWSADIIRHTHADRGNDKLFDRCVNQMEKIHSYFVEGKIINKSVILVAPPQHSKITWAYSCMQFALMHGLKVAPMLDTQEVKRLITLAAERPLDNSLGITYEEYVNSDIVFITVTKTTYRNGAYQIIQEMLDKRSRRGLPTFFVSRYNIATLSQWDSSKSFKYIVDENNTENSLKYPVIINYWVREINSTKGE